MAASTPCTRVCILDPATGLCEGCGRTAGEIAAWSTMTEEARLAVMAQLQTRIRMAFPERGGLDRSGS